MKHFVILVGACLVGLAGCVIETTSGSNGGSGGTAGGGVGGGTAGATNAGGTTASGGGGSTASGGTGGTGGAACVSCGVYVTDGGTLCDGPSTDLYNALADCTCTGACMAVCGDNVCAQMDVTAECQGCVLDTVAGCGNEFQECSNDI